MLLTKRPEQEFRNFLPEEWLKDPRQNVWLLTTMEHQDYLWRMEELLKVPAVVHGISVVADASRVDCSAPRILDTWEAGLGHYWRGEWT